MLTRNFVVPFLLGLKFNLATLLPLIFGGLILLSKKALILGKIALFVSGLFGYGSLFTPGIGYGFGVPSGITGYGFPQRPPFRYGDALSDKPDWDHHQGSHHHVQSDHHHHHHGGSYGSVLSQSDDVGVSSGSGYYKKKDKFLNLDERLEPQAASLVDKFYEYEKQQMMKDRTARLFERKFYETEKEKDGGGSEGMTTTAGRDGLKGDGYTFVTAVDNSERNERSLPAGGVGYRNFAWAEE